MYSSLHEFSLLCCGFVGFFFFHLTLFYHLHLVFTHGNGAARHFNGRKAGAAEPRVASLSAERSDLCVRLIIVPLAMLVVGS